VRSQGERNKPPSFSRREWIRWGGGGWGGGVVWGGGGWGGRQKPLPSPELERRPPRVVVMSEGIAIWGRVKRKVRKIEIREQGDKR